MEAINLNNKGGAINCFDVLSFYAEKFDIKDSKAINGGGISFEESESNKILKNEKSIFYY